jgi:hypothetical protein
VTIRGVLLDEHYDKWWPAAIMAAVTWLNVRRVDEADAPASGTMDPQILEWLEANQFILVTDNRSTMPGHLADFNALGRHVLGIFIAVKDFDVRLLTGELEMIVGASLPGEFLDQIRFLPLAELH